MSLPHLKLSRISNHILDYIYPPSCHHCQTNTSNGRYLCAKCTKDSKRIKAPFCKRCGESFDGHISDELLCPNCLSLDFSFDFARAALLNTNANHQLIVDFKYLKQFHLAGELARFCDDVLANDSRFNSLPQPVLIPVPLHWKRRWKRGFNQANELAIQLSKRSGIPTVKALRRIRNTQTQTRLARKERLKNLNGAFKFTKLPLHFRSAILIDDVFTTGSTTEACAAELKKHAPQLENVVVLTALRG